MQPLPRSEGGQKGKTKDEKGGTSKIQHTARRSVQRGCIRLGRDKGRTRTRRWMKKKKKEKTQSVSSRSAPTCAVGGYSMHEETDLSTTVFDNIQTHQGDASSRAFVCDPFPSLVLLSPPTPCCLRPAVSVALQHQKSKEKGAIFSLGSPFFETPERPRLMCLIFYLK